MKSIRVQCLLFDLGGVAIEIDFYRAFRVWADQSKLSFEKIRKSFSIDNAYKQHECGQIVASEYFDHLRRVLGLAGTDDEIALGWNAIYVKQIDETLQYVTRASRRLPCFAFTNSNPTHQEYWTKAYPDVVAVFRKVFVSSDLGLRKPDCAAFKTVALQIGIPIESILFLDDSPENVRGAQTAGMRAIQVSTSDDVKRGLLRYGAV